MKRIILFAMMIIACVIAPAQSLTDKVTRLQKEAEAKYKAQNAAARQQAAQKAAVVTKTQTAVANAQQQAQNINQQHTVETLAKQHGRKPNVSAGSFTATNYAQKSNIAKIKFGIGAGKSNEVVYEDNENSPKGQPEQGQGGTIGREGGSYQASALHQDVKQFKDNATQKEQQRPQRMPDGTKNDNVKETIVTHMPQDTQYPVGAGQQHPTTRPATQAHSEPGDIDTRPIGLGKPADRPVEIVLPVEKLKEGMSGGKVAINLAIQRQGIKNIENGLTDGWSSSKTAFMEPLYPKATGKKCVVLKSGKCVTQ